MAAVMGDDDDPFRDLEPQPGDDEYITRGEHRRLVTLMVQRFTRIERFLFHDETDAHGHLVSPSLKTVSTAVHRQVTVLCSWARFAKWMGAGLATFGGAYYGAAEVVERGAAFVERFASLLVVFR